MLVLTRKPCERVVIDGNITVTVAEIKGNRVRLVFDAPDDVCIMRSKLVDFLYQNEPDLEGKPAEWEDAGPCLVMQH